MTPKEKAVELLNKFYPLDVEICDLTGDILEGYLDRHVKNCALIAVDEIISNTNRIQKECMAGLSYQNNVAYWQEVKQHIEQL